MTAGPGPDADVRGTTVAELMDAVRAGAHPVWAGHRQVRPVVGDGVQITPLGKSALTAVGSAQVQGLDQSYVSADDDATVQISGWSVMTCTARVRVQARGWSKVVVSDEPGARHPVPGRTMAAQDVPSTPPALLGKELEGLTILHVPVQDAPIPKEIRDEARRLRVIIMDPTGRKYR